MTRTEPRKAKILPIHKEESAALKRLFTMHSKLSQAAFGAEYGLGTQGNVWQYLNAHSPLNAQAAVKFANGLGVSVREFSPRLADEIEGLSSALPDEIEGGDHAPVRLVDAAASAGRGEVIYSDDVRKELMFRRDWLRSKGAKPGKALAFPVKGDSMVDDHIPDGSVVLADTGKTDPLPGKIYVLWLDGELYVKQLAQEGDLWFARSRNKAKAKKYPDIQIDLDGRLVGQVFWCGFEI